MHKMQNDVDKDVLDQIIALAEEAMIRPFSKKKKPDIAVMVGESDDPDQDSDDDSSAEGDDDDDQEGDQKHKLSEEEIQELLEEHMRKGR